MPMPCRAACWDRDDSGQANHSMCPRRPSNDDGKLTIFVAYPRPLSYGVLGRDLEFDGCAGISGGIPGGSLEDMLPVAGRRCVPHHYVGWSFDTLAEVISVKSEPYAAYASIVRCAGQDLYLSGNRGRASHRRS